MMKFKYMIKVMEYKWEDITVLKVLNDLGSKGWELMYIDGHRYTFKKAYNEVLKFS